MSRHLSSLTARPEQFVRCSQPAFDLHEPCCAKPDSFEWSSAPPRPRINSLDSNVSIISGLVLSKNRSKAKTEKRRLAEASANRMPSHRKPMQLFIAIALTGLLTLGAGLPAQSTVDPLEQGFKQPLDSAKPRTWWHWTRSNVTKEGITKDLEWMKRVGIAGFQLADVNAGGGQTVDNKIVFGTPEWFDAVRHAASEADRLGLEMTIFSSAGWSETGGPWVKPEQAMKKLVWSETILEGPQRFGGKLEQPPSNNGPIRNLATGGPRPGSPTSPGPPDPTYYGDSAVIAFRTPPDENDMAQSRPQATTKAGAIDATPLWDDDLNTALTIAAPPDGGPAWVQYEFAQPFKARAISIAGRGGIPVGRILASDNGVDFRTLVTMPGP